MSTGLVARLMGRAAQVRVLLENEIKDGAGRLPALLRHRAAYSDLRGALLQHRAVVALMLARRHGLLEALSPGPLQLEELSRRTGLVVESARTLLYVLESQGLIERRERSYALTDFARVAMLNDGALTLAPLVDLLAAFTSAHDEVAEGLGSGTPPPSLNVMQDEGRSEAFLSAVNMWLYAAGAELLGRVSLPPIERLLVGSMGVSLSSLVLSQHGGARVTYGCLEHLVRRIPTLRARYGVDHCRVDGTHVHGGEPEEDRWGEGEYDLIFLTKKMILDPSARLGERFAKKAFDVLRPGGKLLLWEAIHDDDAPPSRTLAMETVLDLGVSPTGALLTRRGVQGTLLQIGFRDVTFVTCMGGETTFALATRPAA